ncbi:glycosyltransferase family 9 protein [Candidatus Parabeggiatoa sp. HSG14]|uniref:glycosyltransferase family 9 protein n=1 Tax=Candidatus Parabeggiatoa sp. HSG14 TaxID=3055593 RepID=UPI0025A7381E|nr:glycosyltransferase family 9 protein [Thiotrichales bacterium HSG14]
MKKFSAHKILLIATRQIGDVLLATPLLRSLRQAYPDAVIDVLVYKNKGGILEGNPDCNTLISVAEHPNFNEYKTLLKQIFQSYDLAVSTLPGDRPLIYALLAAPKRISIVPPKRWQDMWKRFIVQGWTELDNQKTHTVIQNLRLADLLEITRCYEIIPPQLPDSIEKLDKLLPFAWQKQAFAVLHLVPMWHYKRWTLTGWRQVADYLTQAGLRVVLTGGSDKQEIAYIHQALSNMPETVINLAGQLRFSDVAQLISKSQVYIGPDTAVTHLAATTGVATIALYGPTNPLKWAPWPKYYALDKNPFEYKGTQRVGNIVLVQGVGKCVPCHQEGCECHRQSYSRCLEELESTIIIEEVKKSLAL